MPHLDQIQCINHLVTVENTNDQPSITSTAPTSGTEDIEYTYQVVADDDIGGIVNPLSISGLRVVDALNIDDLTIQHYQMETSIRVDKLSRFNIRTNTKQHIKSAKIHTK